MLSLEYNSSGKNAIREAAERMGARKVIVEEEPKVAAIGAGLDISGSTGNMVIDIGGEQLILPFCHWARLW